MLLVALGGSDQAGSQAGNGDTPQKVHLLDALFFHIPVKNVVGELTADKSAVLPEGQEVVTARSKGLCLQVSRSEALEAVRCNCKDAVQVLHVVRQGVAHECWLCERGRSGSHARDSTFPAHVASDVIRQYGVTGCHVQQDHPPGIWESRHGVLRKKARVFKNVSVKAGRAAVWIGMVAGQSVLHVMRRSHKIA